MAALKAINDFCMLLDKKVSATGLNIFNIPIQKKKLDWSLLHVLKLCKELNAL